MEQWLYDFFVFIFGACIGSFLNVCIYRIPESESIISPGSKCPVCRHQIRFYDNIPVISFLLLKGKCRYCKTPIPFRYLLVEMFSGLFALCVYMKFGLTLEGIVYYIFIASLIVITYIDIDHQIIPDRISLPGILFFFVASFFLPDIHFSDSFLGKRYVDSFLGIVSGGGILFIIGWSYQFIKKKPGMGGGDIKLLAMIGALTGWQGVLFTIYCASLTGTLAGVLVMIQNKKKDLKLPIPFGPFLSIGAIAYIFLGELVKNWYLSF